MAHRVLGIAEILGLIFENLQDDTQSLALSARTCKSFLEPALDVLWKQVRSVDGLEKLMPKSMTKSMTMKIVGNYHSSITIFDTFLQIVDATSDWTRFDFYAKRVRIFGINGTQQMRMHLKLATCRPGYNAFPSLHTLGVNGCGQFTLSMRLPGCLRMLSVHFGSGESASYNGGLYVLSAVSQTPSLENLVLDGLVNPMVLVHVASFKCLCSLDLSEVILSRSPRTIIQDGFRALIGMGSLLELVLPRVLDMDDIPDGTVSRNLRTIGIYGNASFLHRVIGILSRTVTHTVIIHADKTTSTSIPEATEQWKASLDQLRNHCGASLRCIMFFPNKLDRGSQSFEVLTPLLQIHHLENFRTSSALVLSDGDITAMATAWPNIQCLDLNNFRHDNSGKLLESIINSYSDSVGDEVSHADAPTIHCLVPLARLCPKLRTLYMKLNTTNLPSSSRFPYMSHPLQELHLTMGSTRNYVELAVLLDRIFPSLSKITVGGWHRDKEITKLVPEMIHALQSARKERRPVESESG